MSVRCLIVDDSEQFLRAAMSSLSHDGVEVIGTATSAAAALVQVEKLRPDAVLVDVGLGDESGFDLTLQLVDAFPYLASRVVLISTHTRDDLRDLVDASPAVGFICKSDLSSDAVRELLG